MGGRPASAVWQRWWLTPVSSDPRELRIAQGALANVREHAAADHAALTLTLLDDAVVLDVTDDGHGFDPPRLPTPPARNGATACPRCGPAYVPSAAP